MARRRYIALLLGVAWLLAAADNASAQQPPLELIDKIPLGPVAGRIDHMAIDHARHRLFVAEMGNDAVGVVDLEHRALLTQVAGLDEPQGVAYSAEADTLLVANGGNGAVIGYHGADYASADRLDLKDDADNIRMDPMSGQAWVGFGSGALAAIDPATLRKVSEVSLRGHPEGFQTDPSGKYIFVNVPDDREIAVVDRASGRQIDAWKNTDANGNFPMALANNGEKVIVVFRNPARVFAIEGNTGVILAREPTCDDADDVFADDKRQRIYVSCGSGAIDVFQMKDDEILRMARIETVAGARTSLFDVEMDRLFLAVRSTSREPAAIWEYQPE
ncbi:MAG: hypothetical protein EPO08_05340 [Rhodospirillaceae bacterium]|nr:MAG: hypothetical protein EPO08_05340 [Rhodospirillaceae bacterium]